MPSADKELFILKELLMRHGFDVTVRAVSESELLFEVTISHPEDGVQKFEFKGQPEVLAEVLALALEAYTVGHIRGHRRGRKVH